MFLETILNSSTLATKFDPNTLSMDLFSTFPSPGVIVLSFGLLLCGIGSFIVSTHSSSPVPALLPPFSSDPISSWILVLGTNKLLTLLINFWRFDGSFFLFASKSAWYGTSSSLSAVFAGRALSFIKTTINKNSVAPPQESRNNSGSDSW
ncbi:hypothetical protein AX774_g3590 [Zancudomyces culisetae]|uniref:Uncharacterized protein n=1 Tax=Zancudomyces culisetae TaxID=1213189 RepID=A0A1R1PPM1_ZANCU|nr:hypothetical protein AX774_g3590 [Zancudomyces culisetae]|eukprot:OMH82914.1 hypothetical protein AX774_g3590 [Zancudomyces culisetae]